MSTGIGSPREDGLNSWYHDEHVLFQLDVLGPLCRAVHGPRRTSKMEKQSDIDPSCTRTETPVFVIQPGVLSSCCGQTPGGHGRIHCAEPPSCARLAPKPRHQEINRLLRRLGTQHRGVGCIQICLFHRRLVAHQCRRDMGRMEVGPMDAASGHFILHLSSHQLCDRRAPRHLGQARFSAFLRHLPDFFSSACGRSHRSCQGFLATT